MDATDFSMWFWGMYLTSTKMMQRTVIYDRKGCNGLLRNLARLILRVAVRFKVNKEILLSNISVTTEHTFCEILPFLHVTGSAN